MKPTTARFRSLLLFSGLFNIALASPLTTPWTLGPYVTLLSNVNQALGLGGTLSVPEAGAPLLLANTAGIDLVLIGVLVLYAARDPEGRSFIALANAVGRTLFAGIVAYHVLAHDVARLVLVIGGIDVAISLGFVHFLRELARASPHPRSA